MVSSAWRPDQLEVIEKKWEHVIIPSNENMNASMAEKLMIQYLQVREDWVDAYVNASYYEDVCNWKYESAYNLAFMQAEAKSDKGRDITAKSDSVVRVAKLNAIEAHAAVVKTKMKVDGAVLAHHTCKKIYEEASQERRYL